MEDEVMHRISENIDHKSTITKSLRNPSSPGHPRNPQLWHGIHRNDAKVTRNEAYNAEGLKKLIAEI
jgi:hypothetical protein